jgi:hypothetical protein
MMEFKWTISQVERLTFGQLDAILEKFRERNKKLRGETETVDVDRVSVASKATGPEIDAWVKAGCPPTFEKFVEKLRKDKNG